MANRAAKDAGVRAWDWLPNAQGSQQKEYPPLIWSEKPTSGVPTSRLAISGPRRCKHRKGIRGGARTQLRNWRR